MMIYNLSLFAAVAVFTACLVSFHSNPTSAAVIDAGATPPTAATVIDAGATPEDAASVGPGRRRKLLAKKKGGVPLVTSPYKYKTTVINKTGKPLYFKIGPEEQPLLCQSTGKNVTNPASKDPGTYTVAKDTVGGTALSPLCDMAVLASTACSVTPTGDNVHGTTNICALKGGTACQCLYKPPGQGQCTTLCQYCKSGLVTKGPDPNNNNAVTCVEQTDFSPVYELDVGHIALITRTGDTNPNQRLIANDKPFGWNPFEGEKNLQTLFEIGFQANKIYYDISLIPKGCDDIPHSDDSHSNLGWGKQAACASIPANQISMPSCPRCKDNKTGPAFNFGGKMTCDKGGVKYSCLGPVEGTWSTGNGQGWPTFCGNPDTSCAADSNFTQPTVKNEGCTQAFFHPQFYPGYGNDPVPNTNCDAYSPITISICDPTKSTC